MSTLSARCDYYRATTTNVEAITDAAKGYFSLDQTEQAMPLYGYKHALKHIRSGAFYLFGGHTETMGNCAQFGGQAITSLMEESALSSVPAIRRIWDDRWKVTRLDVAIDCFDARISPAAAYLQVQRKNAKTVWRSWRQIVGLNKADGHTVYGGGLESEKRIRIYDKAAEQGLETHWTRFEMVFSGQRADEAWRSVAQCNTDGELLAVALKMLASLLDFPNWDTWQQTFGSEQAHDWTPVPRVESDKWRWLMKQVAPTFTDAWESDGDWRLLDRFVEELKRSQTHAGTE